MSEGSRGLDRFKWWDWEIELSSHLLKRMIDRSFSEVDVRLMMESADEVIKAVEPGRWKIISRFAGRPWEVIVEPDEHDQLLVVVTAYPVSTR